MEYREFLQITQSGGALDPDGAELAARATLTTLFEGLSPDQARDLLEHLPAETRPWVRPDHAAERLDAREFLRRVAEREGVDVETAERHARTVFFALGKAVRPEKIADVADALPEDFEPLVAEASHRYFDVMPAEEFVAKVAARTGLESDAAHRATEAVLEALAERVAGAGIDDLIPRLPLALHDPLRHGRTTTGGTERAMTLDLFLGRVAELESVDPFEASEHARATFATLREAIGADGYAAVTAHLPPDYAVLLPGP